MRRWVDWDGVLPPKGEHLVRQSGWLQDLQPGVFSPALMGIFQRAEALAVAGHNLLGPVKAAPPAWAGGGLQSSAAPVAAAAADDEAAGAGAGSSGSSPQSCTAAHVAYVVFAEVLPRLGAQSPWGADVPALIAGLAAAAARGALDDASKEDRGGLAQLVRATQAQRPSEPGPAEVEDLCAAFFEPAVGLLEILTQHGLALPGLRSAVEGPAGRSPAPQGTASNPARGQPAREDKKGGSFTAAGDGDEEDDGRSALERFGRDLVAQVAEGKVDAVFGRDQEVDRVLRVLARRNKPNVCLVGPPGVGKTAVVEEVARRIHQGRVPKQLAECRKLVQLSLGSLVGGTRYRGEFEQRMTQLLADLSAAGDEVILFIDELHMALGAGETEKGGSMDAANLLKPALARGELRCIGATTTEEYRKVVRGRDKAFERRFVVIDLKEPSEAMAEEMLRALQGTFEQHHRVRVMPEAIRGAVRYSRVLKGRFLPDRALDLLDDAATLASAEGHVAEGEEVPLCTAEHARRAAEEVAAASRGSWRERLLGGVLPLWARL